MARQLKDKWLGARIDDKLYETVNVYTEAAEISTGDLLREAVVDYMINHPVTDVLKRQRTQEEILRSIREGIIQ